MATRGRGPAVLRTVIACLIAVAGQAAVFHLTPLLNRIYDGWPRGWLVLSISMLAALFGGLAPGLAALATGVGLIWWRGTSFVPMHPGLEVFGTIGLIQILIVYWLQRTERELRDRQEALEAERNKARHLHDVAQQANHAKDEFLALLSHELRTPLNVILGYARMLRSHSDDSSFAARAADVIERNAVGQMRIVEDLLDLQRDKSGIRIECGPFDLRALAESVLESLYPVAAAKRLHWVSNVEPLTVDADRARIQQVLWNLLSNAIKFTPAGGCIEVAGVRDGGEIVLTVEDSGEGIPHDFLPHIFEPFRQLDMSTTRRHGGLGLGLAIVRGIVAAHGGTVAAESTGQGSRFTVRLPVVRGEHDEAGGRDGTAWATRAPRADGPPVGDSVERDSLR